MLVETPIVGELGYYLGLLGAFGIGFEFLALKIPQFRMDLRHLVDDIVLSFLSSWQLGFLLIFAATQFLTGWKADMLFFLGLGIAIPDLPTRFKRYWRYLAIIASLAGVLPPWLVAFLQKLPEPKEEKQDTEKKEDSNKKEEVEWSEPEYVK